MKPPEVRVNRHAGSMTITLPNGWSFSRDFFFLLADAINAKSESMKKHDGEDAAYMQQIAKEISEKIQQADDREQNDIANIFR